MRTAAALLMVMLGVVLAAAGLNAAQADADTEVGPKQPRVFSPALRPR
jgi:hypothetical protein